MSIASYASPKVHTVHRAQTVRDCAEVLERYAIGCVVVVDDDDRAIGMVTDRDLTLRALAGTEDRPDEMSVERIMSEPLVTLSPDAETTEALQCMRTTGHRRIPLSREGKAVGLVSIDDVLEVLGTALHELSTELPERRRRALREARIHSAREELEGLYDDVRDKLRRTSWYSREVLFEEIDALRDKLKRALASMELHLP